MTVQIFIFTMGAILVLVISIVAIIQRKSQQGQETQTPQQYKEQLALFKASATQIKVDLNECEIKEYSYTEEEDLYHNTSGLNGNYEAFLNYASGESHRNVKQVQVLQSIVVFHYTNPTTGTTERYISEVFAKDKATLTMYLALQGQTTLYLHRFNKTYYFDFEFIGA